MNQLPLLLEPQQLAALLPLDKVLIIDQSKAETYAEHHVPGAIHLDFKRLQLGGAPTPGALPSLTQLSALFSELGLTPDTTVIAYDDEGGGWAGRLIWALDMIGHSRYAYLNGGIHAWLQDGLATESGINNPVASQYEVTGLQVGFSLSKEDIMARIGQPDFAVWDARSHAEYTGDKVISRRGGHIPGAVNYEWTLGMDKARGLRINNLDEFSALLTSMGLTADKEIATHCQTHHRSGYTYLVGKILGLNIKAYPGSWSEWGNSDETPVTTGEQP
ncbi:sulfurtransferase [Parathalassolituus penaei]|uniref:Rhodanese-like domain-containing protein n=1 Tax=Parathalassolituus penaei TaxID=2997323 RepID=A0A9X3IR06_9GAMM|nr:rhodanese-like domain-containing protein [Parathalassolituus penaei]MCY0964356.1 rhodanese-like domain-containing protein [Parathalassolituus penaei]